MRRERELVPLIREKMGEAEHITIVVESLPLGDIIFCKDEQELLIIERKSVADLAASIKDGRYQEQSYRLDGTELHNHNIVYLIEGNMARATFDKSALYSSMFSLQYYKGFSVWRTFSIDETATILCNSIKYLAKSAATRTGYYVNKTTDELKTSMRQGLCECGKKHQKGQCHAQQCRRNHVVSNTRY